jgi:hypothetical protein
MPAGWEIAIILLWITVAVLAVVVIGTLRRVTAQLGETTPELPRSGSLSSRLVIGSRMPQFTALTEAGEPYGDKNLLGRSTVLLFMAPRCSACDKLASVLRGADAANLAADIVVVTARKDPVFLGLAAGVLTVLEADRNVSAALGVNILPFAVAVDSDAIIRGARPVSDIAQLADLAAMAASDNQVHV